MTKELGAPVPDDVVKAVAMLVDKLAFNTEEEIYSIIKRMTPVKKQKV